MFRASPVQVGVFLYSGKACLTTRQFSTARVDNSRTLRLLAKRKMKLIQSFLPIPIFFYLVMVYYEQLLLFGGDMKVTLLTR